LTEERLTPKRLGVSLLGVSRSRASTIFVRRSSEQFSCVDDATGSATLQDAVRTNRVLEVMRRQTLGVACSASAQVENASDSAYSLREGLLKHFHVGR
jgi:hypothetical protein